MTRNVNFIIHLYSVCASCQMLVSVLLMAVVTLGVFLYFTFSENLNSPHAFLWENTRSMLLLNVAYTLCFWEWSSANTVRVVCAAETKQDNNYSFPKSGLILQPHTPGFVAIHVVMLCFAGWGCWFKSQAAPKVTMKPKGQDHADRHWRYNRDGHFRQLNSSFKVKCRAVLCPRGEGR